MNRKLRSNSKRCSASKRVFGWGSSRTISFTEPGRPRLKKRLLWRSGARPFRSGTWWKRGCFPRPESDADAVSKLLAFFRVGSVDAWTERYGLANVVYRHSPSFTSNEAALATWLRLGELEAERQDCSEYNEGRFKQAARKIRSLTREPVDEALEQTARLCNEAGVALALVPPMSKTALSGAAWWRSSRKAVIQLSARHKSDDHLWFSFFHEAAHILLHSKKSVFVDEAKGMIRGGNRG